MTVSDLIALLEKCDQDKEVYIENTDRTHDFFCDGVHVDNKAVFIQTTD